MSEIDPEDVHADFVELFVKDQFVPRADIWRLQKTLVGSTVYGGKKYDVHVRFT